VLTVKGGKNIHLSTSITLVQALCGAVIPLPHPCGSPIRLKIPCGRVVNDGETISIKGKGMALDAMGETHGDMLVTFKVVFPKQLTHPEVVRLATAFGYDHERESLHFHTHLCP
jgi:DnaJ-class molecular chaperone